MNKEQKTKIIQEFGQNPQDTGSTQVQIAILSRHIAALTEHCKIHPKDFSSRRGLLKMVCQRRKFLTYLAKNDESQYRNLIERLGLRK